MSIEHLESKILSGNGLNSLSDNELYELAIHFVGDAPPSNIPRETIINILSEQSSIKDWQDNVKAKAAKIATERISQTVQNVQSKVEEKSDDPMVVMIKDRFGKWLQESGYSVQELTIKLDANSDGVISIEEISDFIVELTGSQPPGWVLTHISSILDGNNDGVIMVSELWEYLEEIGFTMPVIEEPKIETLEENQPVINEEEMDDFEKEFENDSTELEIDEEVVEQEIIEVEDSPSEPIIEEVIEDVSISTTIEITIEMLGNSRLHSDANKIIANSKSGNCNLKVERIEQNLMVSDSYRGGKTLVGVLDGGPFSVSVLFEPEFNDLIEQKISKNNTVSFVASLYEWSSGLRRAKLKGNSLTLKD
tara:strand:- start:732 stop:1826 length:1095 start_codon:yes stop_codon:yes gene_type:complete